MHALETREFKKAKTSEHNLLVPYILPDEFYLGFLGRVAIINNHVSPAETNKLISNWIRETGHAVHMQTYPIAFSLAKLLKLSVNDFVKQHTLEAINGRIKSKRLPSPKNINEISSLKSLQALTSIQLKPSACFCTECVKEDVDYRGFSYWRRSHQLIGVDWCLKHNIILSEVKTAKPFRTTPASHLNLNNYVNSDIDNYAEHPVILRYSQLLNDVLDLKESLDFKATSQVILNQSKTHNVRASIVGKKKTLSDLMIEKLPTEWLNKHFPNLKKEEAGTFLYGFDDIQKPNGTSKSCINTLLAAAVVFDSPDEAIFKLITYQYTPQNQTKTNNINSQTFLESYIKNNGNVRKVAEEESIGYLSALKNATKMGLPTLSNIDRKTFEAIQDFYNGSDLLTLMQNPEINHEKFTMAIRTAGTQFSSTIKKLTVNKHK